MQTPYKKRKLQVSPGVDEDEDWENDFTVEEFDFLQSQIAEDITCDPANSGTQNQELRTEEKHALEGQISMLRQSLNQKSQELENLRKEQAQLASTHLKEQQEMEKQHLLNIDRLKSALKFKEHELTSEQDKVKTLENKLKTAIVGTANNVPRTSPVKLLPGLSHSSFLSTGCKVHSATQTEPAEVIKSKQHCFLTLSASYSDSICYITNMHGSDAEVGCVNKLLKSAHKKQDCRSALSGLDVNPCIFQINANNFQRFPLKNKCFCCKGTDISLGTDLVKDVQVLQNFESQLKQKKQTLEIMQLESSSNFYEAPSFVLLLEQISRMLVDLCNFLMSSQSACGLLVKMQKEHSDTSLSSQRLLPLIYSLGTPLFKNHLLLNGSVINWCLKVLITICESCKYCCCNVFANVWQDMKLCKILDGMCSNENAYLGLKFLEHCISVKKLFIHDEGQCILLSISELCKQCFSQDIPKLQQSKCIFSCFHLLRSVILFHGVTAVYSVKCRCIVKILNEVFNFLSDQASYDECLLLEVFTLIQVLYKLLEDDSWFQLRSRLNDNFVSMLNRICHATDLNLSPLKEVIVELREHENISLK